MSNDVEDGARRPDIVVPLCLTVAAVAVFAFLYYWSGRSLLSSLVAFLSIEGAALLACSMQPDNDPETWHDRVFGTKYVNPIRFSPLLFYLGLFLLAVAAFTGAFA